MPVTLQNPYARKPGQQYRWLKGNFHGHSTLSDGSRAPQTVIDLYAALGHDFMALTDHDKYSNYTPLDAKGLILIHGNEVTAYGPHVLQIGGGGRIDPHEDRQRVIDQVNAAGGFAVINHPNWEADWDHCPFELLQKLKGYVGMEVFNGVCLDIEGSHVAIDKWERMLATGRLVWAFANDDSHHADHEGRAWNVVQVTSDQATEAGIIAAVKAGHFYASTGVAIDSIETSGTELHIKAGNAQAIEIFGEKGRRLAHVNGAEIRFDAGKVNSFFIRAQLYGPGSSMAWTQPFILQGGAADQRRRLEEKFGGDNAERPTLKALRVEHIGAAGTAESEGQWHKAPESSVFYDRVSGENPPVKTAVRALVSSMQLALRIDCEEPAMDKVRATITEDGSADIWMDDSLEIFLDVEGERKRNYQMMINPLGAFFAGHPAGWGKGLEHAAKATRSDKGWSVEVVFDLATLAPGIAVGPGTRFGFHVCRNRNAVDGHYMWSWVGTSNHAPARYGWLQL